MSAAQCQQPSSELPDSDSEAQTARLENSRQTRHRHTRKEVIIWGWNQGTHEGTWLVGGVDWSVSRVSYLHGFAFEQLIVKNLPSAWTRQDPLRALRHQHSRLDIYREKTQRRSENIYRARVRKWENEGGVKGIGSESKRGAIVGDTTECGRETKQNERQ